MGEFAIPGILVKAILDMLLNCTQPNKHEISDFQYQINSHE